MSRKAIILAMAVVGGVFAVIGVVYAVTGTLTPSTIDIDTYEDALGHWQGWTTATVTPSDTANIWVYAEDLGYCDLIEIDGEDWLQWYPGVTADGETIYISVWQEDGGHNGAGCVSIFQDDNDMEFDPEPGGGDTLLDASPLYGYPQ